MFSQIAARSKSCATTSPSDCAQATRSVTNTETSSLRWTPRKLLRPSVKRAVQTAVKMLVVFYLLLRSQHALNRLWSSWSANAEISLELAALLSMTLAWALELSAWLSALGSCTSALVRAESEEQEEQRHVIRC